VNAYNDALHDIFGREHRLEDGGGVLEIESEYFSRLGPSIEFFLIDDSSVIWNGGDESIDIGGKIFSRDFHDAVVSVKHAASTRSENGIGFCLGARRILAIWNKYVLS